LLLLFIRIKIKSKSKSKIISPKFTLMDGVDGTHSKRRQKE